MESVLTFLGAQNRLPVFLSKIQKERTAQHRDNLLAEARGAYFLARNSFDILEWEPPGEGATRGEVLVYLHGSAESFVEVKQPGWQSERLPLLTSDRLRLAPDEKDRRLNRMKRPNFFAGTVEGGAIGPHHIAMSVVRRNALPKLTGQQPPTSSSWWMILWCPRPRRLRD